jgi:type I restriction enzyme S subunit
LARPSRFINSIYLNCYLQSFYLSGDVKNYQGGSNNLRNLKFKEYSQICIPIPSLAEQNQIAAKLDELLAQVDGIKTRLDAIPNILKRFRQSVLAAAVSGKLTEDWRINNFPEAFLRSEIGQEEFRGSKLADLPRNWKWLRFDQVAKIAANLQDPLLNPNAIHIAPNHIESGSGKLFDYQTVLEDQVTSPKHRFYEGQILYSKIRPYLCKVVIANFSGLCSADMYPIDSLINTEFLFRWMLTSQFTDWASNAESRSVLPKINQKDLSKIPVPTPPLEEQIEIIRRVEQLFAYADQIEQRVKDAQARVNHLTQSILAKAFRGELTADWRAQNPDLISGENSAESLLERINAERKSDKSSSKTRKNHD